jgi:hypothetical protein
MHRRRAAPARVMVQLQLLSFELEPSLSDGFWSDEDAMGLARCAFSWASKCSSSSFSETSNFYCLPESRRLERSWELISCV